MDAEEDEEMRVGSTSSRRADRLLGMDRQGSFTAFEVRRTERGQGSAAGLEGRSVETLKKRERM